MKKFVIVASALSILTLQGCGTFPQTADEFRKSVQQHSSLMKVETIEVNRPFSDVSMVDPLVKTKNQGVFSGSYNLPLS